MTGRMAAIAGSVFTIGWALAIGLIAGEPGEMEPPDANAGIGFLLVLAAPGVIGLMGAATDRQVLLVPAGLLCVGQSFLSFSWITLPFGIAGAMILRAAVATDSRPGEPWRPRRIALMFLTGIPLAFLLVRFTGFLGVLAMLVIGGVGGALGRTDGPRIERRDALVGLAVLALLLGGWYGQLGLREPRCWVANVDGDGGLAWTRAPASSSITVQDGQVGGRCDSAAPTEIGQIVSGASLAGAVVVSLAARRGRGATASA
jgi:hypothetical protein